MGVGSAVFLGNCLDRAVAQIPKTPVQIHPSESTISQVNVLFVNPSVGDDKQGKVSESTPLKTITQALRIAAPNTTIKLAKGTYSSQTGEVFPLILKPGVTLQGDASSKGRNIIIAGGGDYLSRSFGSKNVVIVGAKEAQLIGVTITNSNPRGYGLWIESSNLTVAENTFTGSTQDGVTVTGNGKPIIRHNLFYRNGANGITITGTSDAEVRENVFQETGFGINIAQKAQPLIVGNQIQDNRSGMIVQAASRPIIRKNIIQGSKEDGLVAIAQAQPDLGRLADAGGNEFRNNKRYDINANAAKQTIPAYGNTLVSDRIVGKVDTKGTTAPIARNLQSQPQPTETAMGVPRALTEMRALRSANVRNSQQPSVVSRLRVTPSKLKEPTSTKTETSPIPSTLTSRQTVRGWQQTDASGKSQTNNVQIANNDDNVIEFVAPAAQSLPVLQPVPPGEAALLSVPSAKIPFGNTTNMRKVPVPGASAKPSQVRSSLSGQSQAVGRYRVMAAVQTQKDQELVRFLAPGAFATSWQGKAAMQVGVFSSRSNAEQMLKILNDNGLQATMELIGN
ncbi:DUF1565 domain-containing protein [Chlorogloeopsis sp. ULAP01]|uniref:DUF1565 domain-containing protein n=1 Tax=Chlorogloeopsis sp. ULAP01 TaxID=3056483 RepID=UPI0025AAF98B|nr:DUF1565 domain-containing protein [Chlorogloeopsis sp. ULAP01]MDM9381360.1 DUF1565 domain-containing protein [Chlorogloeopsis sp. ULAP01]